MTDLLIKGVEMPAFCADCDFNNIFSEIPYCRRLMQAVPTRGRLDNCPLVEVPPSAERKGKWYPIGNSGLATCKCGFITDRYSIYNYCPNCGERKDRDDNA